MPTARRPSTPIPGLLAGRHLLQDLIWPEPGGDPVLAVRLEGAARVDGARREIGFDAGGRASFDTWLNLFDAGTWCGRFGLDDPCLTLTGSGRVDLALYRTLPLGAPQCLLSRSATLAPGRPLEIDAAAAGATDGVVHAVVTALGEARLTGINWHTARPPRRQPRLALCITSFRREAALGRIVTRFRARLRGEPMAHTLAMIVVDNGRSATLPRAAPGSGQASAVIRLDNRNLGGAGGFARGLIEARARGASHCLFMDDDSAVPMDSVLRTWRLLAHAADPATAVAGAMLDADRPWLVWENGATFHLGCHPLGHDTDLRDPEATLGLALAAQGPAPAHLYGGWWFFAFPLDRVRHLPFPFFVRGDDVSFSLANDFAILRPPGIVALQQDFTVKESPLTWYLDLRSHLAHHLSLPGMATGPLRCLRLAWWFAARALVRHHYETLEAINLALGDVIAGPGRIAAEPDLAGRRVEIAALTRTEAWGPRRDLPQRRWLDSKYRLARLLMKLTLNGHLLPGFGLLGNRVTLPARERGWLRPHWGAAVVNYVSADGSQSYSVRHSKARALRPVLRHLALSLRFLAAYPRLCATWRAAYPDLTGAAWWEQALNLEPLGEPGAAAIAPPLFRDA